VLEIALERMPLPLPDDEPLVAASADAAVPPVELSDSVKH
jgi:ATP-dependent Lon protease